jgi:16S rRNA (guanine527-N7)-methyltransferase
VEPQIAHSRRFAAALYGEPRSFLDLGSGGGVPGLVLAVLWSHSRGVLLDASARRAEFLRWACGALGLDERIRVVHERAEVAAGSPQLREAFTVVTARGFGPPAVTAECAVAFLAPGGRLVVSEPPDDDPGRWPAAGLARLGLEVERAPTGSDRFVVLRRTGDPEPRFPRRLGIPAKRPLWR